MNQYNSYYLYQQYEKRGNQDWLPSYPNIFSVDGDGTMPLVMKKENDPDCGYTGDTQPIYRWYPLPITTDYICDECPSVTYRWTQTEDTICIEIPSGTKFYAGYGDGRTYTKACDGSTSLTSSDTQPTGYTASDMKYAVVGDCVTSVRGFGGCMGLKSVYIPEGVTRIGGMAFYLCTSLPSLILPSTVTSIGDQALDFLHSLSSLTCLATTPPSIDSSILEESNPYIYVPAASVSAYKTASGWRQFSSRISAIPT